MELFHLIDSRNFDALRASGVLRCASSLMSADERKQYEKTKRNEDVTLASGVVLRDQQPLTERIVFCDDTTFPEYVAYINGHVFFWPVKSPDGFCNKYSHHIVLRCQLGALKEENPKKDILFSPYNSGSTLGCPNSSPRSRSLFQPIALQGKKSPKEIVVRGEVKLPRNTQYKNERGAWCDFFSDSDDEKSANDEKPKQMKKSPLAPNAFPALPPVDGVKLATCETGVKYHGRDDLMLAVVDEGATAAGVFTRSSIVGAPVTWCRRLLADEEARALIVNAGNANTCTGEVGDRHVLETCQAVAAAIACEPEQVLAASTGVIGEPLPVEKIVNAVPRLASSLSAGSWARAAVAIGTTDTFAKGATARAVISGAPVTINGIAKGSGMIEPDMATLLAFLFTDAAIPRPLLQALLAAAADKSFNAITVDGDASTSDTCILFATGRAANSPPEHADTRALDDFKGALEKVMVDLALQVIRDGEGAQKLITVEVRGAEDHRAAKTVAKSIANSPLVKTAIAGADANWGRIVMAVGKSGAHVDPARLTIAIGGTPVVAQGRRVDDFDEAPLDRHLKGREILIEVDLGLADGCARVWTCDLTHGYIEINADYRS